MRAAYVTELGGPAPRSGSTLASAQVGCHHRHVKRLALDDTADAHRRVEAGVRGRLVVQPGR